SFDLCYSSTLTNVDALPVYVDCERGERYAGHSHMNVFKLYIHGLRMLMPFLDHIAVRFLVFFFLTTVLGVILSIVALSARFFGLCSIPPWALYSLLALLLLS